MKTAGHTSTTTTTNNNNNSNNQNNRNNIQDTILSDDSMVEDESSSFFIDEKVACNTVTPDTVTKENTVHEIVSGGLNRLREQSIKVESEHKHTPRFNDEEEHSDFNSQPKTRPQNMNDKEEEKQGEFFRETDPCYSQAAAAVAAAAQSTTKQCAEETTSDVTEYNRNKYAKANDVANDVDKKTLKDSQPHGLNHQNSDDDSSSRWDPVAIAASTPTSCLTSPVTNYSRPGAVAVRGQAFASSSRRHHHRRRRGQNNRQHSNTVQQQQNEEDQHHNPMERHQEILQLQQEAAIVEIVDDEDLEKDFRQRLENELIDATDVRVAEECNDDDNLDNNGSSHHRRHQQRCFIMMTLIVLCVVVMAVILGVVLSNNGNTTDTSPTLAPTMTISEYLFQLLEPISGMEALTTPLSPQQQAYQWLTQQLQEHQDNIELFNVYNPDNEMELRQRYILAVLYFSTGGPTEWFETLSFLTPTTVCHWASPISNSTTSTSSKGVECDVNQQVQSISIESNNLNGTIPNEISQLQKLQILRLSQNPFLTGSIPNQLNQLSSSMTILDLGGCGLTGTVPSTLQKVTSLSYLQLSSNALTGSLPFNFFSLDMMWALDMVDISHNQLTGTIPTFQTQARVRTVRLNGNQLQGNIPTTLYSCIKLEVLDLSHNQLTGTIGQQIVSLTNLAHLALDDNSLDGTIPTELGSLWRLSHLTLNDNLFYGTIPYPLGELRYVSTLYLSNNQLTGTIPTDLADLEQLEYLRLDSNKLIIGSFPFELAANLEKLNSLQIQDTSLTNGLEEAFCRNSTSSGIIRLPNITADCGGLNPTIHCSCCSQCCSYSSDDEGSLGRSIHSCVNHDG